MWIAKAFKRSLRMAELTAMGKIAFFALAVYEVFRIGDVVLRGQLGATLSGPKSGLFLIEIALGGIVPLVLLSTQSLRSKPQVLAVGAFLSVAGVVLNRVSTVALAMNLKGPMPQIAAESYTPSAVEWGVSLGLIAATIFLFGLAVRHMPVLPKEEAGHQ
jgi:formate dehydrogenase iron-sulfur subunit